MFLERRRFLAAVVSKPVLDLWFHLQALEVAKPILLHKNSERPARCCSEAQRQIDLFWK